MKPVGMVFHVPSIGMLHDQRQAAGGLVVLGVVTSSVVGKFVPTTGAKDRHLTSR